LNKKRATYFAGLVTTLVLLVSCAGTNKTKLEPIAAASDAEGIHWQEPLEYGPYSMSHQIYLQGIAALESEQWLEAQQMLDLALNEALMVDVSEIEDESILRNRVFLVQRILEGLESVYPELTRLGEIDSLYGMEWMVDEEAPVIDQQDQQDWVAFLDTLTLSQFSLPVEIREEVVREIHFLTRNRKDFMEGSLGRMAMFEEMILAKLRERNMPEDLIYLSLVESGFKVRAYSVASASGLWQFIASTGTRYGLKVDWWVDMRRHPEMATDAALDYLSDLYSEFGDWQLAMAAYNCGEGRVRRLIRQTGSRSFWDLPVPRETRHYVPRILAAAIVGRYREHYEINVVPEKRDAFDTLTVFHPIPLSEIASSLGTPESEIRQLNPELRRWVTPPNAAQYTVRLPAGSRERFALAYAQMDKSKLVGWTHHRVRAGENLSVIARQYGVTVAAIRSSNNLRSDLLRVNTNLVIPVPPGASGTQGRASAAVASAPTRAPVARTAVPANTPAARYYEVRRGDNLYDISRRLGVSVSNLQEWNDLSNTSLIRVGQKLRLFPGETYSGKEREIFKYEVKRGDSYSTIARAYGVTVQDLLSLNNTTSTRLNIGQQIMVPKELTPKSRSTTTAQPTTKRETYVVQRGDNLTSIARRFNVTIDQIIGWNNLRSANAIYANQRLTIHRIETATAPSQTRPMWYVVKSGDNLWDIARRFGIDVQTIMAWNQLDGGHILPGLRLKVGEY
jgi:membrane-bound lytic murein transglycosylase D